MPENSTSTPNKPCPQVVWKSTTTVGCGFAAACKMVVCNYSPAGNVIGQEAANI